MYIFDIFKRYKLDIRERTIFDPIRNKYVSLTPEEKIRQQTIKYLIQRLKIPPNRIGVEKSLHQLGDIGNKKRVDICIFDEDTIIDRADFVDCTKRAEGLSYVILNGQIVAENAVYTGAKPGGFLLRNR